ncbi:MAG: LysE family transporter [Deltaproteobacteria bacterium]
MHLLMLFGTAFVVAMTGAMIPGPMLTVTVAESARRGFWTGPLIVLGHGILELMLILALLAGLSAYLTRPAVTNVISVAGGVFILYMGFNILKDLRLGRLSLAESASSPDGDPRMNPVLAGILVSLSNPYWSFWWAAIGLTYLTLAVKSGWLGVAAFFSGHILADLSWYSLVSLGVSAGRNVLKPLVYQVVLGVCGVFLLGLGIWFISGVFTGS